MPTALRRLRPVVTLLLLAVLLLAGVAWGWSRVTAPLPGDEEATGPCEETTVAAGDEVTPEDVTVSVLNAGSREGLASLTMQSLVDRGFGKGQGSNAPADTRVRRVEIWTREPQNPAVRLVASYLRDRGEKVRIRDKEAPAVGVNVVVGDRFDHVSKGKAVVQADDEFVICRPV